MYTYRRLKYILHIDVDKVHGSPKAPPIGGTSQDLDGAQLGGEPLLLP